MSVTKVAAKPAEYRTIKVADAAAPKIVVEMSMHAALSFAALAGKFGANEDDAGLHDALAGHPLYKRYREVRDGWLRSDGSAALKFPDLTHGYDVDGSTLPESVEPGPDHYEPA